MAIDPLIEVRSLIEDGRFPVALRQVNDYLKNSPSCGEGYVLRALCMVHTGHAEAAEDVARQGIALAQDKRLGHFVLSRVLSSREDHGGALSAIENAIKLDSGIVEFWCQKAIVQAARRRFSDAEASIRKALSLDPEHALARKLRTAFETEETLVLESAPMESSAADQVKSGLSSRLLLRILETVDDPSHEDLDSLRDVICGQSALYRWIHDYSKWVQENPWLEYGCMFTTAIAGYVVGKLWPDGKPTHDGLVAIFRGFVVYSYLNWMSLSLKYLFLSMNSRWKEQITSDEHHEALAVGGIFMLTGVLMTGRFTDPLYYRQAIAMSLFLAIPASRIFRPRVADARFFVVLLTLVYFLTGLGPTLFVSFVEILPGEALSRMLRTLVDAHWICLAIVVLLLKFLAPHRDR